MLSFLSVPILLALATPSSVSGAVIEKRDFARASALIDKLNADYIPYDQKTKGFAYHAEGQYWLDHHKLSLTVRGDIDNATTQLIFIPPASNQTAAQANKLLAQVTVTTQRTIQTLRDYVTNRENITSYNLYRNQAFSDLVFLKNYTHNFEVVFVAKTPISNMASAKKLTSSLDSAFTSAVEIYRTTNPDPNP